MLYSAGVCVSPAVGHGAKLGFVGNVFSKQGWLRFASFWFGSSEQLIVYQSRERLKLLEIKAEYRLAASSQQQMPDTHTLWLLQDISLAVGAFSKACPLQTQWKG